MSGNTSCRLSRQRPKTARETDYFMEETRRMVMKETGLTPAKRKRLLKTFGPCPTGYTTKELEQFLDLLYGLYRQVYTQEELRHMIVSDPFDRSETPRQLKLVDLTDWLEAVVS